MDLDSLAVRIRAAQKVVEAIHYARAVGVSISDFDAFHALRQLEEVYAETTGVWYPEVPPKDAKEGS